MKNYNEMTESLFERRENFNRVKKAKMKKVKIAVSTFSCFCLAVLLGVGVMYKDVQKKEPDTKSITESKAESVIKINKVGSIDKYRANVDLSTTDCTKLSAEEIDKTMKNEFNIGMTPKIPNDLKLQTEEGVKAGYYTITANGEISNVSFSTIFNYSNEDSSRNVKLEVYKGDVFSDAAKWDDDNNFEKSEIKNTDVYIASDSKGCYFAKSSNKDTTFRLITEGLTEQELISIIESLVD